MMHAHSFIIIAEDENDDLESCIKSIINQSSKSNVLIYTNTPNDFIIDMASKYSLGVIINDEDINYNFLINFLDSKLVTIANQSDLYDRNYTKEIVKCYRQNKDASIIFTNNYEIKDDIKITNNVNLWKKRLLMKLMKYTKLQNCPLIKKISLYFIQSFCTSSVTFIRKNIPRDLFPYDFHYYNDWIGFINLARLKSKFVYLDQMLIGNRILKRDDLKLMEESKKVHELIWNVKMIDDFYERKRRKYERKNK